MTLEADAAPVFVEPASDAFIEKSLKPKAAEILRKARSTCDEILRNAREGIASWAGSQVDLKDICFVAVGSVGRREALAASDLDLIPITRTPEALETYAPLDSALRAQLRDRLGLKISKGEDLTRCCSLASLLDRHTIGGPEDGSTPLTKRVLVLTEGRWAGGNLPFAEVQRSIIQAYGEQERSSGRHVLSLCNDIARYYRTLCVEYKWKADDKDNDWCTRNLKLRHSRKFWYFSCIMAISLLAERHPRGDDDYVEQLLKVLATSPVERVVNSPLVHQPVELARLLEHYSMFLEFMSDADNRAKLSQIEHGDRYSMEKGTAFPMLKFNSDLLHLQMMRLIEGLSQTSRQRIYDWFLF